MDVVDLETHPQSPSSLVLGSLDLVETILEHFVPSPDFATCPDSQTRRSLLEASLISKCFAQPALNILWRHMNSLLPLVQLIPAMDRNVCFPSV
jgi:hypothetical protein